MIGFFMKCNNPLRYVNKEMFREKVKGNTALLIYRNFAL